MRVGIITYHFPYNSGAALQCLALQTILQNLGNEVSIINYRPWYHQNRYTPHKKIIFSMQDFYEKNVNLKPIKRIAKSVHFGYKTLCFNLFQSKEFKICDKKFSGFVKSYLNETCVYRTWEQLKNTPPKCDVIISGSDQLWNTALTNGEFDPSYFMTFVPENCRKATYAIGVNFLDNPSTLMKVGRLLNGLEMISLREEKFLRSIKRVCGANTRLYQHIDPTLLLKQCDYERFESTQIQFPQSPYILTYTMGDKSQGRVYSAAKKLREESGLLIIDITGNPLRKDTVFGVGSIKAGPDEFLSYIKNARYVITNSFHGTAFSIIYHKQFVVVPHSKTGNRVTDLLERVGLNSRWSENVDTCIEALKKSIDYTYVEDKINSLKNESLKYLSIVCCDDRI